MASQKLELRQGQSLVMTQRLQQSIKLLQLPAVELQAFVLAEVQENPLLSLSDADPNEPPEPESSGEGPDNDRSDEESSGEEDARGLDTEEESWWGEEQSVASSRESDSAVSHS